MGLLMWCICPVPDMSIFYFLLPAWYVGFFVTVQWHDRLSLKLSILKALCMCFIGCKIWKWQRAGFLVELSPHLGIVTLYLSVYLNIELHLFIAHMSSDLWLERRWRLPKFVDGVWKVHGHCGNSFCYIPFFPHRAFGSVAIFIKII